MLGNINGRCIEFYFFFLNKLTLQYERILMKKKYNNETTIIAVVLCVSHGSCVYVSIVIQTFKSYEYN